MYRISVIMPIYNNEATLRPAIESILDQSGFDFELILINDGSTDSSAQICMEYAKREPLLIKVMNQNRLGFSNARNKGLNQAKGSYIYFADAENIFSPRMLESNLKLAEEQKAELVVFGFSEMDEDKNDIIQNIPKLPFLLTKERFINHFRNFYNFFPYELCNKLYEVKYLREKGIKFREISLKEKSFFNLDVYKKLNKVVFNRKSYCQIPYSRDSDLIGYQMELLNIHIELLDELKNIFIYWGETQEYQDLIIRECYQLVEAEVLNVTNPRLNLSNKELKKEIQSILTDQRISDILSKENILSTNKIYEKILWDSFCKGNIRAIVKLVESKKKTDKLSRSIKEKFTKWLN